MALQIKNASPTFGPLSGLGPNTAIKTVTMPAAVTQATAILTGFTVEFSHGDDHHLGQLDVQVQVMGTPSAPASPYRSPIACATGPGTGTIIRRNRVLSVVGVGCRLFNALYMRRIRYPAANQTREPL